MSNPFVIQVGDIPNGSMEHITTQGPSPVRWGGQMMAVEEGTTVAIDATVNNLGEAFMVNATVSGEGAGTCSRCLRALSPELSVSISEVFGTSAEFIQGDEADEDEDEPPLVVDNAVDISQSVVDEAGLNAPFSPVCADYDLDCEEATPAPDGISEEQEEEDSLDPRWAGLEKFKNLGGSDSGKDA